MHKTGWKFADAKTSGANKVLTENNNSDGDLGGADLRKIWYHSTLVLQSVVHDRTPIVARMSCGSAPPKSPAFVDAHSYFTIFPCCMNHCSLLELVCSLTA